MNRPKLQPGPRKSKLHEFAWIAGVLFAASVGFALAAPAPAPVSSPPAQIVLTPPGEKGDPLVVSGVIYEANGRTPAAGARILVYHTDASGHYSKGGQDRGSATFSGRLVTGADGRYSIRTIRPGHYPGGHTPQHIHYSIEAKDGRTVTTELRFADDPVLDADSRNRAREAARRGDRFFTVRPVERNAKGVQVCSFDVRLPGND